MLQSLQALVSALDLRRVATTLSLLLLFINGPFPLFLAVLIVATVFFPRFIEGLVLFILLDALMRAKIEPLGLTLVAFVIFYIGIELSRERIRFIPQMQ